MLTPMDVQSKAFKSGMGYSKADVDAFLTTLYADYEALFLENKELKEEIGLLSENISRYKDIEKSLQKALVLAETTSEETIAAAKKNAEVIEQEAAVRAEAVIADAKMQMENLCQASAAIMHQYQTFKTQYEALAKAQLDLLNSQAFSVNAIAVDPLILDEKPVAVPVHEAPEMPVVTPAEDEDETVASDDSMIKDIASIFD